MSAGKLPEGWVNTTIENISVKCSQRVPLENEEFIYVDIGSINRDLKLIESPQYLSGKKAPSRARKVIKAGDIIVSLTRPNLNAVALVDEKYEDQIASTGFEVIHPVQVQSKYIFGLVRSRHFIDSISGLVQGALYPAAKSSDVQSYEFPLPPLAEQKIIAEKLDTLLAQVDSTKARLEQIPQILKRFRQAMLAAAVSGKLTGVNIIPLGNLGDITDIISGVAFKKSQYATSGYRLLQIANVTYGRTCWDSVSYIPLVLAKQYSKYSLKVGDIALALNRPITNNRLKVTCICNNDLPSTLYQRVARFRVKENNSFISSDYLLLIMQSFSFLKKIEENLKGSDQPYINTSTLDKFQIFAPSLPEQHEIVRRVEQLFAYADTIEKQVNNALTRVNNLTQSILAKAFRGELTAQWRAENPELISGENSAAALLEKIKAERAASGSKKASRKKT